MATASCCFPPPASPRGGVTRSSSWPGFDLDPAAIGLARGRLADVPVPVSLAVRDFTRVPDEGPPPGQFDLIITNPPYVRTQVLGAEVSVSSPPASSCTAGST